MTFKGPFQPKLLYVSMILLGFQNINIYLCLLMRLLVQGILELLCPSLENLLHPLDLGGLQALSVQLHSDLIKHG